MNHFAVSVTELWSNKVRDYIKIRRAALEEDIVRRNMSSLFWNMAFENYKDLNWAKAPGIDINSVLPWAKAQGNSKKQG